MNTMTRKNLVVALGAALVAGSMLSAGTASAQDNGFNTFASQARANVLAETTAQPGTGERLREMQRTIAGARVVPGVSIAEQGELALADLRAETLASFRHNAAGAVGLTLAQASVEPVRLAETRPARQRDWSLPEVEIKPLIDMNLLLFSFEK